ncbi:large protein with 8 or more transmembrane domains within nh2 related protein [Cyclospora cayetanensis]|uniref:Large protein with 8 or more transmembrane domains within nh2 related protein n=1 Tax=Cyclospora cayetanensis TaxID=88456 RepID=A0A1D3CXX0_9EIME|nr:large protein with 8 or more transmembrane domains within nh2 related protein [Cyclospora cayetanensis]
MPLQLPPSVFTYSRLLRLCLDLAVVLALVGSMMYVALDSNTWDYAPVRIIPTIIGWSLFALSLLLSDKLYQLYKEWLQGWPSLNSWQTLSTECRWCRSFRKCGTESMDFKHLNASETYLARVVRWVMLLHANLKNGIHRVCSRPSFRAAAVLWAIGFSVTWCSTLADWRRDSNEERWDFGNLSTTEYAIQEVFLAAATLEFILSFLHQMELLSLVLSPSFWVEVATLPPCIAAVHFAFGTFLGDYRISQVLLLMGCLRWLKSFVGYGDIHPTTWLGQGLCAVLIVTSLVWVPREFAVLIESFSSRKKILGSLPLRFFDSSFILLVGDVSPSQLSAFIQHRLPLTLPMTEKPCLPLAHSLCVHVCPCLRTLGIQETRLRCVTPPKLVVLTAENLNTYSHQLQEAQLGRVRMCIVSGEAGIGGVHGDLTLVKPTHSRGVFVLSAPASFNVFCDRQVLTRVVSVLKEGVDPTRCCVQLGTEICANVLATMGVTSFTILSDLKMSLISRSLSDCPGIIPLITNLSGSAYPDVPLGVLQSRFSPEAMQHIEAYIRGAKHALYSFSVPPCMYGMTFEVGHVPGAPFVQYSASCKVGEVTVNLFRVSGVITVGFRRGQTPLPGRGISCDDVLSRACACCFPRLAARRGCIGASLSLMKSSSLGVLHPPSGSSTTTRPSYWLNPYGNNCVLGAGDKLIIIAPSVAVAECLQYATRLPWARPFFRMRTLVSHLRQAGETKVSCLVKPDLFHRKSLSKVVDKRGTRNSAFALRPAEEATGFAAVSPTEELPTIATNPLVAVEEASPAFANSGPSTGVDEQHSDSFFALLSAPISPMCEHASCPLQAYTVSARRTTGCGSNTPCDLFSGLAGGASAGAAILQSRSGPRAFSRNPETEAGPSSPAQSNSSSRNSSTLEASMPSPHTSPTRPSHGGVSTIAGKAPDTSRRSSRFLGKSEVHVGHKLVQGRPAESQLVLDASKTAGLQPTLSRVHFETVRRSGGATTSACLLGACVHVPPRNRGSLQDGLLLPRPSPFHVERQGSILSEETFDDLAHADTSKLFVSSAAEAYERSFVDATKPLILVCGWPKFLSRLLKKLSLGSGNNVIVLAAETPPPWSDLKMLLPYASFTAIINGQPLNEKMEVLQSSGARISDGSPNVGNGALKSINAFGFSGSFSSKGRCNVSARLEPHPLRCKPPGPAPSSAGPSPPRKSFWRRRGAAFRLQRGPVKRNSRDGPFKFKKPFLFRRFVGEELVIIELQDHDNWRFITDAEWIEKDLRQAPCYSTASYLHSTAYMNGSFFCDRMLYSVITQNPTLSEFSVPPQLLVELVGNSIVTSARGLQLEDVPDYAFEEDGTFGRLFETMLLRDKIPIALYRQ